MPLLNCDQIRKLAFDDKQVAIVVKRYDVNSFAVVVRDKGNGVLGGLSSSSDPTELAVFATIEGCVLVAFTLSPENRLHFEVWGDDASL